MAQRTVVVAGNGTIGKNAIYDLLADWLGYEEDGEEYAATKRASDVHFVFLAHSDLISKTLQHVYNWTGRANIDYTAIYAQRDSSKAVELIVENAEESHASGDVDNLYADAVTLLGERKGEKSLVVLSDTDGDDGKDAGCDEFIIAASKAGVEILDLGCGLIPYPVQKAVERAMRDQEAEEPEGETSEAEVQEAEAPAGDLQEDIAQAHRAQELTPATAGDRDLTPLLLRLVTVVEGIASEIDSRLVVDFYRERSVLSEIRDALQPPVEKTVPEPKPEGPYPVEDEAEGAEGAPAPETPKEVRKGWYNDELKEYLPFRGRPRRDVEKHDIIQDDSGKWVRYEPEAA